MRVKDQVAFVTGGASGIGLGIAAALAERGSTIALTDARPSALEAAAGRLRDSGARVTSYSLDVTDRRQFAEVARAVGTDLGPVGILVNNAGVGYSGTPVHEIPDSDVDWVIDVNIRGVLNGIRALVPGMVARGAGYVVNVSSMSGLALPAGIHHGLYGATKAAVVFLSDELRADVAASGVGVSVLCPGYVRTNLPWSGRYRGAAYGGPHASTPSPRILASLGEALDPRAVGEMTVDAVERETFFVFTDRGEVSDVDAWHARIDAALRDFTA